MNLETVHENIDGIILSIHVKNFFCHENLFIDFARKKDENVHSIMGHNGSGKSTILTALVIGLGGRAASTFRGYNLQSFIKRGETTATIKIKIKNSSPRAYKPDIYGDSITIVRTINTTGGSYKIRCVSGAYKSTTASVIKEIVNAHDIQIENPISVLNQDDARSFHGVNAKEKYGAFRRATNFAKIEENYNTAQENCKEAAIKLARKNEAFLELSKEYKRLKMTYDQMKPPEEIENEKRRLHNELKWFDVAKLEAEVEKRNADCERFRSTCNGFSKTLQSIEEKYANIASTLDSLRRPLSEPAARREALERELSEAETEAHRAADRTRVARTSRNHTRDRLLRERRQATDLAEAIRTVESGADDGVTRREELERAKEEASAAVAELRARRDTGLHEERQARDHATRAAEEAEKAADALRAQERQLERHKVELAALRQCSADSLAVFGEPMVELCRLVERAVRQGRFSQPPRGPVGNFLKVRNKEWASALEHVIGAAMKRFCVNSRSDSNLLFEIMGKLFPVGKKPSVTTTAFRSGVHDVRARRVSAPVGTCALDELEITDHVVANFLIDNLKLETVLLVANHEDAVRLTDSVQNVPANCSKVVTKDCTDYMPASATSSYRIYGGVEHPPRYLNTSTVDRTRQMEAKIAELEKSVEENGSQRAHLARQAETARRAQDRSAKTLHLLQSELRKGERAAKDAEEALQQHSAPRLAVLKENYESCNGTVTKLEAEELQLTEKEQTLEEKKKDAETRVAEVKKELEVVNREYRRLQEEINQKQIKLEQSATEKTSYQHRLSEETVRLQREEDALEERQTALTDLQEGLGHRPERLRDKTEVQSQLRLLERQLSAASASTQSREEVRARLHDATERCTRVRDELDAIKVLIDKNNKIAKNHLKNCYTMQNNIGRHVALKFTNILKLSNYVGHMELDHAEGELELYIANRNTKSLSGGERSYSTVALFMAMWECVELPFYFMDEFDVFMDGVNRKIIWELLVDFAKRRKGRQFVFLTQRELPISRGSIEVHRLGNPRD